MYDEKMLLKDAYASTSLRGIYEARKLNYVTAYAIGWNVVEHAEL